MPSKETKINGEQQIGYQRTEEFYSDYANNVFLENSVWDLKLVFGQLDQSVSPPAIEQRAAITIPWTQVKILSYLLSVHLVGFEIANGKIKIPEGLIPPEPPPPTQSQRKAEPNFDQIVEAIRKLRVQFFDLKST